MHYHMFAAARSLKDVSNDVSTDRAPDCPSGRTLERNAENHEALEGRPVGAWGGRAQAVAMTALFFATKVEDTPKRAREVLMACLAVQGNELASASDTQATAVRMRPHAPSAKRVPCAHRRPPPRGMPALAISRGLP